MTATSTTPWSTVPGPETGLKLPVDRILPADDNPRTDLGDIEGLTASIAEHGLLEPIVVGGDADDHGRFTLVAGHRRLAAIQAGGWTHVNVVVDVRTTGADDDRRRRQAQLVENLHRKELNPIEEATGMAQLVETGMTQADVADLVGTTQSHVSKRIKLLQLPEKVRSWVISGRDAGGITIEEGLELASLQPEELERIAPGGAPSPAAISKAVDLSRNVRARKNAAAKLKKAGVEYVVWPSTMGWNLSWLGTRGDTVAVAPEDHKGCPSEVICILEDGTLEPHCTEPRQQHAAPPLPDNTEKSRRQRTHEEAEALSDQADVERQRRNAEAVTANEERSAKRDAWRDLACRRIDFGRELLDAPAVSMIEVVRLAGAVLPLAGPDSMRQVAEHLGCDEDASFEDAIGFLAVQPPIRALHSVALLAGEDCWPAFSGADSRDDLIHAARVYLNHLEAGGYEADPMELEAVAEQLAIDTADLSSYEPPTAAETEPTEEQETPAAPGINISQVNRGNRVRWAVTCNACGELGRTPATTRRFAEARAASHLDQVHPGFAEQAGR